MFLTRRKGSDTMQGTRGETHKQLHRGRTP